MKNNQLKRIMFFSFLPMVLLIIQGYSPSTNTKDQKLIDEMRASLITEILNTWYPITLDTVYGGFLSDFTYDWHPKGAQNKMLVTQTRHVWTSSEAAMFTNDDIYRKIADHGFRFIKDNMWDKTYGGFYMLRNREGKDIMESFGDEKRAYGNAFAIYALSAYYKISGDTAALNLAKKTFLWLDKHSHDPVHKGYFNLLTREGKWFSQTNYKSKSRDKRLANWKDYNSSIHLLEAFYELYKIWPDSLVYERLSEMLTLIRDTITTQKGYMKLYFERNWKPVSIPDLPKKINYFINNVSFGHDIETAYLMLEASHTLGIKPDTITLSVAKKMVDHTLAKGWDKENGGFYEAGYYTPGSGSISIISETKVWWVQAEGLNALLLMAKLYPKEEKYYDAFLKQWEYIKKYLIDHTHGGWYIEGLDKSPGKQKAPKATVWKINYHTARSLMNCIKLLQSEHELLKEN